MASVLAENLKTCWSLALYYSFCIFIIYDCISPCKAIQGAVTQQIERQFPN